MDSYAWYIISMLGSGECRTASRSVMKNIKAMKRGKLVSRPINMVMMMTCGTLLPGCDISSLMWMAALR
jgi:predicted metal-binding protein